MQADPVTVQQLAEQTTVALTGLPQPFEIHRAICHPPRTPPLAQLTPRVPPINAVSPVVNCQPERPTHRNFNIVRKTNPARQLFRVSARAKPMIRGYH